MIQPSPAVRSVLLAGLLSLLALPAAAATFTVDSEADAPDAAVGDAACQTAAGTCTLRAAIQEANADPSADVIAFALPLPRTITLTVGTLVVTQPLTVDGPGADQLFIDGAGSTGLGDRLILVNPPAAATPGVTLRGLTLSGGFVSAVPRQGGAILANPDAGDAATLVLEGVTISDNEVVSGGGNPGLGGGVYLGGGTLQATDTRIERNVLSGTGNDFAGAGLYVFDGTATLERCSIAGNTLPEGFAAGIRVRAGSVSILDTTVENNRAVVAQGPQAWGGGVSIGTTAGTAGTFVASRSTFSGNSSDQGGGLYVQAGSATLTNCTFWGNTADCHGAAIRVGDLGTADLNNCTIAGNAVVLNRPGCWGNGGGVFTEAGQVTITNTIVAGNTGFLGGAAGAANDFGTDRNRLTPNLVSGGWNVFGVLDGVEAPLPTQASDQSGVPGSPLDPVLQSVLTYNGGFTLTLGPLAGSPAIERGNPATVGGVPACQPDDQRHATRPLDGDLDGTPICDVGAVEGCVGPDDADGDFFGDTCDNCRLLANFPQGDGEADGVGDSCDNCTIVVNPFQDDTDGDLRGDACDNCPRDSNPLHAVDTDCNADGDTIDPGERAGEQCDVDLDDIGDICDCFPDDASNPQLSAVGNLDVDRILPADAFIDWQPVPNALGYNVYRGFLPKNVEFPDGLITLQCFGGGDFRTTEATDVLRRPEGLFWYLVSSFCIGAESDLGPDFYGVPRWAPPFVRPTCPEPVRDRDGDGTQDAADVCPLLANPGQADADGDFRGDDCESCPYAYDPLGFDDDNDGTGNACDCDRDQDGFVNPGNDPAGVACGAAPLDNCVAVANPLQEDTDGDGVGDACDNCVDVFNATQFNRDHDLCGEACDASDSDPAIC